MTILAATLAMLTPMPAQEAPPPYWTERAGCGHGHTRQVTNGSLTRLLRNHRPLTPRRERHVRHLGACTFTRAGHQIAKRRIAKLREWRQSYAHKWPIKFNSLPQAWQNWAYATGACETGNNPATSTGNSFHGAFQFLLSTWWAAGGTGYPEQHSWAYQAWIAVHWRMRSSQAQWPNCAPW